MRIHRSFLGQTSVPVTSLVVTAGPTMPANVAAANAIINQQPYQNLVIQLAQQPLASASGSNAIPVSSASSNAQTAAAQYEAMPSSTQASELAQLQALWQWLPSYVANAPTVQSWNQQNLGPSPDYVGMGNYLQSFLPAFFSAIGVQAPSQSSSSGGSTSSSGSDTTVLIAAAIAAGVVILLLVNR